MLHLLIYEIGCAQRFVLYIICFDLKFIKLCTCTQQFVQLKEYTWKIAFMVVEKISTYFCFMINIVLQKLKHLMWFIITHLLGAFTWWSESWFTLYAASTCLFVSSFAHISWASIGENVVWCLPFLSIFIRIWVDIKRNIIKYLLLKKAYSLFEFGQSWIHRIQEEKMNILKTFMYL